MPKLVSLVERIQDHNCHFDYHFKMPKIFKDLSSENNDGCCLSTAKTRMDQGQV